MDTDATTIPEQRRDRLELVFRPLDLLGTLVLDIPVPLQAGLLPVAILCRHPGQPSLFALADLFVGGLRPTLLLAAAGIALGAVWLAFSGLARARFNETN